jgi:hypothetical protein
MASIHRVSLQCIKRRSGLVLRGIKTPPARWAAKGSQAHAAFNPYAC